jgi:catechol 2,3-dioxygenase-like lactoylglutathione lyase family enzyme
MPQRMAAVAPVLPTRDVQRSLEHYRRLGFEVRAYRPEDGAPGYGYLHWDEVDLHLSRWDEHDPLTTASQVYLYVDDADALHTQWQAAGVEGRFIAPSDAEYGLREGAHVDPEGNLIRYGSWLPGHGPGH